jgi:hypothetical protein
MGYMNAITINRFLKKMMRRHPPAQLVASDSDIMEIVLVLSVRKHWILYASRTDVTTDGATVP